MKRDNRNRDQEIYEAYVQRCKQMGIPQKDIATFQKYFEVVKTYYGGSL